MGNAIFFSSCVLIEIFIRFFFVVYFPFLKSYFSSLVKKCFEMSFENEIKKGPIHRKIKCFFFYQLFQLINFQLKKICVQRKH